MNTLRIPLLSLPEAGVEVVAELSVAELQPADGDSLPGDRVSLQGWLTPLDDAYLFRGEACGEFVHPCDRCLAEARLPYVVEILWTFEEGPPLSPFEHFSGGAVDAEDEFLEASCVQRFQGVEIDLTSPLWEELVLAAPEKYLCRDDCLGLCLQCGSNLNEGNCGCAPEQAQSNLSNHGLAGLADLFPGLTLQEPKE